MYDILCCMMCHVLSCVMFIQYVQYNICNIYAQYIYGMEGYGVYSIGTR
jgi:hypothetical protein